MNKYCIIGFNKQGQGFYLSRSRKESKQWTPHKNQRWTTTNLIQANDIELRLNLKTNNKNCPWAYFTVGQAPTK